MKNHFVYMLLILLFASCSFESNDNDKNQEIISDTLMVDESDEPKVLPPPSFDVERDSVDKVMSVKSPFLKEGCCNKEEDRLKKCCCDAVAESYRALINNSDKSATKLGMTDPILAKCRLEMPAIFDKIENPESEKDEEVDIF